MWSIVPWRKPLLIFRHISSSRNSIYSTIVKEAGRKIIFGSAEEEGKRRGEEVEKSEVYENIFPTTSLTKEMRIGGWENIFPKTNLTKEMRRGVRWAGPGGLLFPRLPSHSPLFQRSVSWLTCTRTGPYLILKQFLTVPLHVLVLCIGFAIVFPEMIKQSLPHMQSIYV